MKNSILFTPFKAGALELRSRIVMAPLTRARADADGTPNPLMVTYYMQRASAGLIVTEATAISRQGYGCFKAPGIFLDSHTAGWRKVTSGVHAAGGRIFMQLWHMGRVSHPDFNDGKLPVSSSAVRVEGESHTPSGKKPYVTPRALAPEEIRDVVRDYADAALRAKDAGFDGVEIHAANGYLIDQFIRDGANKRTDEYGGSIPNRLRLLREATEAVASAWSPDRTAVRLSPVNEFNDMSDSDPAATFTSAASMLDSLGIAYLHVLEAPRGHFLGSGLPPVTPLMREAFKGAFMVNGGYDGERATQTIESGGADLVAFGVPFIANPDLPKRLESGAPLNAADPSTFYAGGEKGYTDYPFL